MGRKGDNIFGNQYRVAGKALGAACYDQLAKFLPLGDSRYHGEIHSRPPPWADFQELRDTGPQHVFPPFPAKSENREQINVPDIIRSVALKENRATASIPGFYLLRNK